MLKSKNPKTADFVEICEITVETKEYHKKTKL
jgi:hypothetical protein